MGIGSRWTQIKLHTLHIYVHVHVNDCIQKENTDWNLHTDMRWSHSERALTGRAISEWMEILSLFDNTNTRKLSEVANHHTGISPNWGRVQEGGCTHHMSCCCHWKLPQALFPSSPPPFNTHLNHAGSECGTASWICKGTHEQRLCISSFLHMYTYACIYMYVTFSLHIYLQPMHYISSSVKEQHG